jgi:hypothetical protein
MWLPISFHLSSIYKTSDPGRLKPRVNYFLISDCRTQSMGGMPVRFLKKRVK